MSDAPEHKPRNSKLWLWIVFACLLQLAAWTVWFMIAARHRVQEVPLVSGSGIK